MADTQRFAIWHPPGMPAEVKKPASVPIIPEQPQALNKNIENLVKDFKWNDSFGAAKSTPLPTSRPRIQSVSSYTRPSVAPQPIHLATHLSKTDEDDSEPTSEEEVVKIPPVMMRKFSSSSPPKPILSSTPVNSNLSNTRPKPTEKVSFALPKETPKENENNLSRTRIKPIEKPTSQGPKVASKQSSPASVQFPEQPKHAPGLKKPVGATEAKKDPAPEPKPLMRSPPPIESRRITPPDSKIALQRKQEIPKPIPVPAPALASSQIGRQPLAPINNQGFVTHNGFISLDAFVTQLQDEAFDSVKLSMMEASIRQFHLIAADADVQLTRKLCSIKTANIAEKRRALIEEHKQFMEAQASSLLTDMSALHDQLKEQQTMSARGLFDIPVDEDGWERPLPPSTVPWKTPSPPTQSKSSDSWKLVSEPPKTVQPRASPPMHDPEPEVTMPSFWKPSWDANFTEPSTPQVPPISRLATVEDVLDEDGVPESAAPVPVPVPKNAKPTPAPTQQPIPMKNQASSVADEPTPIWGQPTWQQENRQSQTHCRTRPRNPLRSLLRYPPLPRSPLPHHRSLLLLPILLPCPLQLPHPHRPSPRRLNNFGRRKIVKAKARQQ
ncbi:hypothetical protein BDM02DRAFT_2568309 [Thelephora ganbajun]|uniref:Uncharacterized protein n=1 Tax=Thelephora ganbajun TaxID=370292 RepID=A0ACB6ZTF8_THEGA|nr:hypothetical protein BDM02DRAFT_2568309 [Thelephora ganbajun]